MDSSNGRIKSDTADKQPTINTEMAASAVSAAKKTSVYNEWRDEEKDATLQKQADEYHRKLYKNKTFSHWKWLALDGKREVIAVTTTIQKWWRKEKLRKKAAANNTSVIVGATLVDDDHSAESAPLVSSAGGSAARNATRSGSGGGGGAAPNYQTLSSNDLFGAIESDQLLSTNPRWVASILNKRKNKKEDFKAAFHLLLSIRGANNPVGSVTLALQQVQDGAKWLNSHELTLLTEFAVRLKIAATNNNVHNQNRLDTLVDDLNERSSTARKMAWLAFGFFVLTVAASLAIGAAVTWPTLPMIGLFVKSLLPKVFHGIVAGVSALQVLSFWSGYSRRSASNMLADVSIAAEGFFASQSRLKATNPRDVVAMVAAGSSATAEERDSLLKTPSITVSAASTSSIG